MIQHKALKQLESHCTGTVASTVKGVKGVTAVKGVTSLNTFPRPMPISD